MIYVGIDVAKDKHNCFITNSDGEVLFQVFTIQNNRDGFHDLFSRIQSISSDVSNIKVGLEATGHYSYNLLGYLIDKGLLTFVINPLHTNLYRKSLSLRKMKTDKVDARTIAMMLMSNVNLKSYSDTSYHNEELKSPTRYHRDKAIEIRDATTVSIGSNMPAKSLELRHTLRLIGELDSEITEIESKIKRIMNHISSPILTIPGIGYCMGAMCTG